MERSASPATPKLVSSARSRRHRSKENTNISKQQIQKCTHRQASKTQKTVHRRGRNEAGFLKLDQEVFKSFQPLLDDCRDYAQLSGCRFRSRSFDGLAGKASRKEASLPEAGATTATVVCLDDVDSVLAAARARATPAVYRFAERIRSGEIALLEELDKANRIVIAESVRNTMIATCQVLELWPPSPAPAGISNDDCAFEDVSTPVPVVAQRLYNDEKRRRRLGTRKGETDPMCRLALTASFIVEFASAAGVSLPETPKTYDVMRRDFEEQASEWEQKRAAATADVGAATSIWDLLSDSNVTAFQQFGEQAQRAMDDMKSRFVVQSSSPQEHVNGMDELVYRRTFKECSQPCLP